MDIKPLKVGDKIIIGNDNLAFGGNVGTVCYVASDTVKVAGFDTIKIFEVEVTSGRTFAFGLGKAKGYMLYGATKDNVDRCERIQLWSFIRTADRLSAEAWRDVSLDDMRTIVGILGPVVAK